MTPSFCSAAACLAPPPQPPYTAPECFDTESASLTAKAVRHSSMPPREHHTGLSPDSPILQKSPAKQALPHSSSGMLHLPGVPCLPAPPCPQDMYSYGCLLYEMLSGRTPWPGRNMMYIAHAVVNRRLRPPLHELSHERCPPPLRAVVVACWDADPQRRPAAAEVAKELMALQDRMRHRAAAAAAAESEKEGTSSGGPNGAKALRQQVNARDLICKLYMPKGRVGHTVR